MTATLRDLLTLAWPIVVSRSTQTVIGVSDALMVAHLGEASLAATTTGAMNTFTLLILPMGVCFIVSSFSAQLHGAGDSAGARRYGWYGLGLAVATQALCLVSLPVVGWALGGLGYAPAVLAQMDDYMAIRLWGGGAAIGLEALANYYGGLGDTQVPMRANVLAMVCNLGLNWVLINGHLGAPAMGVSGAALASAISSGIAFLYLFSRFWRQATAIPATWLWPEFGRMLRFGLPSGMNWFLEFLAFMFFVNVVVAGLGTTALAAFMAVLQINSVSFMPAFGMASAGAILVGQHIGAGLKDAVPGIAKLTLKVCATWQGTVGLLYLLLPGLIFAPFAKGSATEAQALLTVGAHLLLLSSLWQLFDSGVAVFAEALRAAGDTAWPMWARTELGWAFFVPGSWYTVHRLGWGVDAAMFWIVGYIGLLALMMVLRFRAGVWRSIELVQGAPNAH